MTEKPNMYHKGKIYKIVNDINDDIYLGSTVKQLSNRMGGHRSKAKQFPERKIYITMNEIGIAHFKIILVESYKCETKDELRAREDYYINLLKPALNMIMAFRTEDQLKEYKQGYQQDYQEMNKDILIEQRKLYRKEHKESIQLQRTVCVMCEVCNIEINKAHKSRHNKSKKHLSNVD
jgi:group I intron endonuclease